MQIDALCWDDVLLKIAGWTSNKESRVVCICNVHSVVTAKRNIEFRRVLAGADMATPDGVPIAWMLRRLGYSHQQRINGPDLLWRYCSMAELRLESIFLYGSTEATLELLKLRLLAAFPKLIVAGAISPPFRPLTPAEDIEIVEHINASGAGVVFVGLGCPKQEIWMAAHLGRIHAVMVGVGAAFDYHAGVIKRAPQWMQNGGLEWLHRLASEPRRLWRRYLVTNTLFVVWAARQLIFKR